MINTSQHAPTDRRAPPALWAIAHACLCTLRALFGGPRDVAAAGWLSRARCRLLRAWLHAARAVIARLLLIEAAALPAPAPTRACQARQRPPSSIQHGAENPAAWRVSLRLPLGRRRPSRAAKTPATRRDTLNTWPLAERYEALLRAYADPAPYARRLARRLHAAPSCADELLARTVLNPGLIGAEARVALDRAVACAVGVIAARVGIRAPPPGAPA